MDKKQFERVPFRQWLSLYGLYARMDAAWFFRDTRYALLGVLADLLSNLAAVTGIFLLAFRFDGVGGMGRWEVLFMLGYYTAVSGVYTMFCAGGNTGHISRRIGRGHLDHMMIMPLPVRTQLSVEGFIPFSGSSGLISGICILAISIHALGITLPWWWVLSFVGNLLLSLSILLTQSYFFSSAAFYAPVAAEEISTTVMELQMDLSQYPLSGMPSWLQWGLIGVFPAGLLAWFPSMTLLGKTPLGVSPFFPVLVAVVLFVIARFVFLKGWKHYVTTGSIRYMPQGYRR